MEDFSTNITVKNNYFSDNDAIRIAVKKVLLIFIVIYKIQHDQARKKNFLFF